MASLRRTPTDMRNYLTWYHRTTETHRSVAEYVRKEKLKWDLPIEPASTMPFEDARDVKIIRNDWPYGLTPDITHMVVWSRARIPVTAEDGSPTEESTRLIERFIDRAFMRDIGAGADDKLLWFKQKSKFQSVGALEHIHVLVRGVDELLIEKWTGQQAGSIHARTFQAI
jgi:Protein of unknown function (DUF3605)